MSDITSKFVRNRTKEFAIDADDYAIKYETELQATNDKDKFAKRLRNNITVSNINV
jgi:hypothetical protein